MEINEAIEYLKVTKTFAEDNSVGGIKKLMCDTAISALEEIQQYREIGTVEECRKAIKKYKPKDIIHIHTEYEKHIWKCDKDGNIDMFAMSMDIHNGPACERCGYTFCEHCDPNEWNAEPCVVDEYLCPTCHEHVSRIAEFCQNCGQAIQWNKSQESK